MTLLRRELRRFLAAVQYFTRLPVPSWVGHDQAQLDAAVRYFPAVGILVGVSGGVTWLVAARWWPRPVDVTLALIVMVAMTGAFHEDGLADAVDGLGGALERDRALEIMKDSRIGSFGAVALVLSLLLKFAVLQTFGPGVAVLVLIAAHAVSRLGAVGIIATSPYVVEAAHSRSKPLVRSVSWTTVLIASVIGLATPLLLRWPGLAGIAAVGVACALWRRYLDERIGGYTGDCLGAAQQIGECVFYLTIVAMR